MTAGRSYPGALFLHDRRMARSSPGGQSSPRIAAFFRGPARMRPKTFPSYQNASPAPYNTYRVSLCFLAATLFVFRPSPSRPLPAYRRAHIRMSAPSRRSRRTSKLKRKGQKEWRQNACTIPCRHWRPSLCKESGAGHLSAHAAKTALQLRTAHYLPPSKNAARERSLRDENEKYITSDRVFARRGGAAGVEAKCLHDSVQAFAAVALQRKRCGTLVRSRRKTGAATSDGALFTAKQKRSERAQFAGRKGEICNERPCFCAAWRSRRSGSKMPARFRAGIRGRRLAKKAVRDTCPLTPQNRRCDLGRRTVYRQAKTQRESAVCGTKRRNM